mmetsp:Transcript_17735/g.21526  ORF Transcript_17735/g.21526 Transcript_17735/m.21526 type:complete len:625 (-) Transcript_17735:1241-3115(-)
MFSPSSSSYVSTSDEEGYRYDHEQDQEHKEPYPDANFFSQPDGQFYPDDGLSSFLTVADDFNETNSVQAEEKPFSLEKVFDILYSASKGVLDPNIAVRPHASPITPSENCFYVSPDLSKKKRRRSNKKEEQIRVKYQSYHNTEIWWSPEKDYCMGIIARAMSKKSRSQATNAADEVKFHGFVGCWYSLVRRESKDSPVPSSLKSLVIDDVPSLVHFVRKNPTEGSFSGTSTKIASKWKETMDSEAVSTSFVKFETVPKKVVEPLRIDRDVVISGGLTVNNLNVKGNLRVEGTITGQLMTPPGAADYAEWFAYLDPSENIEEGMVVQLKCPESKITLNTSGDGPHLIVSTKPSIAAGVDSGVPGALCGFIGQVPVRVIGPIKSGAILFPSGKHDGMAVAGNTLHHGFNHDPIGTAMTSCGEGTHTILAFIRWQHNLKWQTLKKKESNLKQAIVNMSQYILPTFALLAWWFADIQKRNRSRFYKRAFLGFSLVPLWVTMHLPGYHQFMSRDIYWILPVLGGGCVFNLGYLVQYARSPARGDQSAAIMYLLSFLNLASIMVSSIKLKIATLRYAASVDEEPSWMEKKLSRLWSFRGVLDWVDISKEIVEKNRVEKEIIGQLLFKKLD